jgi:N-acetylglucosamine-6-sulfatase
MYFPRMDVMTTSLRRRLLVGAVTAATFVALAACAPGTGRGKSVSGAATTPPNIVFVLTDDLSWNLVQYMPSVLQLEQDGTTFPNYVVADSLCCPSRSSIFTGDFPHDTGVFTNGGNDGGFGTFHGRGDENNTYATVLQSQGYATAMMGKYLNGYTPSDPLGGTLPYVPPGWTEWDVAGNGYPEYNYDLNENHTVVPYGSAPADFGVNVLSKKGSAFITKEAAAHTPFALEIATFAPHAPYAAANQDLDKFPGLTVPHTPAYDTLPANPPSWLAPHVALTAAQKTTIDTDFRKRVQAIQSVDRMITSLRATLVSAGVADNTYVVFSSDNGYHMGDFRLMPGKQTAFDTDVRVPLVVAGPGVVAGASRSEAVQNIDLTPTFQRIGGADVASTVDGRSILPILAGQPATDWRNAQLIEHHGPNNDPADPDVQTAAAANPITYEALRTAAYTYVEYSNGEREYYNRTTDPYELNNIAGTLSASRLSALSTALAGLENCHNHADCWTAGHVTVS